MKVFLQGSGPVDLGPQEFVATGGQASVFVKNGTAFKVYTDPKDAIPAEKFHALAAIQDDAVIRPQALLLDGQQKRIGYAMSAVPPPYHSLCQLFTPAFRDRHKVDEKTVLSLASRLRAHVLAVHRAGVLIIDLNELNILVSEQFDRLFLIDVDSYQTPQFPATVIMPSVRDWHAQKFSELTDWFSYAVLAFQLLIGAHPFKGGFVHPELSQVPKDERMEWRMKRNLSAFRKEAKLPGCCYSFDVIPQPFRSWLEAVLSDGKRLPPPDPSSSPAPFVVTAPRVLSSTGAVTIEKLAEMGFLLGYDCGLSLQRVGGLPRAEYLGSSWQGDWMKELGVGATVLGFTPKMGRPIALQRSPQNQLVLYDFERRQRQEVALRVDEVNKSGSRFYIRSFSDVVELGFLEQPSGITVMAAYKVADVMPRASRLYEGCSVQSFLGSVYVSVFPETQYGYQSRMSELDGVKVLDAKFQPGKEGGVLMVIGARKDGRYDRHVFRFDGKFESYDHRVVTSDSPALLNFLVLATGVTAALVEEDALEVFLAQKGHATLRRVESDLLGADLRLVAVKDGLGFTRGNELYRMRLS